MNYSEFILRRHLRIYTTYIHKNRKGYRIYKGVEIAEEDFMKATEMPQRPYICASNPCRKHQYLNVEGCCITNLENLVRCAL